MKIFRIERINKSVTYGYFFNFRIYYCKKTEYYQVIRFLFIRRKKTNYLNLLTSAINSNVAINKSLNSSFLKMLNGVEQKSENTIKTIDFRDSILNVAYIFDEKYLYPTYVSLHSLLRSRTSSRKNFYDIYLFAVNVPQERLKVFNYFNSYVNCKINIINKNVDELSIPDITSPGFHVSKAATVKFYLSEILKFKNKLLYIDSDTLIEKDISELYGSDISQNYAAVVEDIQPKLKYKPPILVKLGITNHRCYFNSGMLLLNLDKIRKDLISRKLIDYRVKGINYFMDQDAFNVVFKDNVKYLPAKYNFLMHLFERFTVKDILKYYNISKHYNSIFDLIGYSSIVHFSSKHKPWSILNTNGFLWYKELFLDKNNLLDSLRKDFFDNQVVVSFTTYRKRIDKIEPVINSILDQSFTNFKLILWLSDKEYNLTNIPKFITSKISEKFQVKFCSEMFSYKKLLPSLKEYGDSIIVTADDDIIYNKDWLLELVCSYITEPNAIHCHRGHRISFDNEKQKVNSYSKWTRNVCSAESSFDILPTGCGGVLYPPKSLHTTVIDYSLASRLCPSGDDIWFWCNALLRNTKIKTVPFSTFKLNFAEGTQDSSLFILNDKNGANDKMIENVTGYFKSDILNHFLVVNS